MKQIKKMILSALLVAIMLLTTAFNYPDASSLRDVNTAPKVTKEMLSAEYWIQKMDNPDQVLLTPEQIRAYDVTMFYTLAQQKNVMFDLASYNGTWTAEQNKAIVSGFKMPKGTFYKNGQPLDATYWNPIVTNMDAEKAANHVGVTYGMTVHRTNLRIFPTDDILNDSLTDVESDAMQNSGVLMNEPVAIFQTSKDGKWYFVRTMFAAGWMHSEDVGTCDYDTWVRSQSFQDLLVVTGDKISLEADPTNPAISDLELYMGTALPMVAEGYYPPEIARRIVYDNYVVWIPARAADGSLYYTYGLVPVSRDVSRGYLPYTKANVLRQAFKALGNRYGWGGMYQSRDCSEFSMEIYRCFGFHLPRNSKSQSVMLGKSFIWDDTTSKEQRMADLKEAGPGAILYFPGHIMIYLGNVDGEEYVISALGSFIPNEDGVVLSARGVMVNSLNVRRRNGKTWLENLTAVKAMVY